MSFLSKIPSFLYNKYFVALAAFLIYTLIFDTNNISSQIKMGSQLNQLREERQFYLDEISQDSTALHEIMDDNENLERFAREQYLMKRDNEDVFLIIGEDFIKIPSSEEKQ